MTGRDGGRGPASPSRVAGTLAVVAAVVLVVPTGGLSSMGADRGVAIDVVSDSSALVGYEATCEDGDLTVSVVDRLPGDVAGGEVTIDGTTAPLGGDLEATFASGEFAPGDRATVSVAGSGIAATLYDRPLPDCSGD
jgi:hypothetical protein